MGTYKQKGKVAGILFLIGTLGSAVQTTLFYRFNSGESFLSVMWLSLIVWIISLLFALSLITDTIPMAKITAIIMAIEAALGLVSLMLMLSRAKLPINSYLNSVFSFLCWLFVSIALFKHGKQAKVLCLLALGMNLLNHLSNVFGGYIGALSTSSVQGNSSGSSNLFGSTGAEIMPLVLSLSFSILSLISFYYLGLYLKDKPIEAKKTNRPLTDTKSSIEKVSELKGLLDKGIITQEEFDMKKKEIIG